MAFSAQVVDKLADLRVSLPLVVIISTILWHRIRQGTSVYDSFPRIGGGLLSSVWPPPVQDTVWEGYQAVTKVTDKPFTVQWWAKDYLILPPRYLSSLRDAGWSHLSFFRNISDAFFLHTSVGDMYDRDDMVQVVTKGLNPRLPQTTSIMEEEVAYALEAELNGRQDGAVVTAQSFFTAIVHRSACRILIGEELCRNERFIQISTDFVMSIFITGLVIVKLPLGPFRNLLAHVLAAWHRVKLARCVKMLLPVVQARLDEWNGSGHRREDRCDAIEWSLMLAKSPATLDARDLSRELMHNLWAGTSAPGGMVTDIVFQLLLEPRYQEPLAKEADAAWGAERRWTEKALGQMPQLDSFIREIGRLYPTGSITCSRTVLGKPFTFPDGLTLPVGTRFGFPTKAMQTDASDVFDGFRFARAASDDTANKGALNSATAMVPTNLAWGYGSHVCPGRFFAVRTIKMTVARLLHDYELEWEGRVRERPAPMMIEGQFIPNLRQKVKLRKRRHEKPPGRPE